MFNRLNVKNMRRFKDFVVVASNVSLFAFIYCALAQYETAGSVLMIVFLFLFFLKVLFVALDSDE